MRWLRRVIVLIVALAVLVVGGSWLLVTWLARDRSYSVQAAPHHAVALVMGAAITNNRPSPYLQGRLDVAAELYRADKVEVIIVSGNREEYYSEPDVMAQALVAAGVPGERIVTDYEGFDTYASCQRASRVFGVRELTVVTQDYHLARSIASCRLLGVDAIGVGDDTRTRDARLTRYRLRELGGNVKLVWDLLTRRQVPDQEPSDAVTRALG